MMAPQTTEFGAKVGLLAGLVVMCPLRGLFERAPAVMRRPTSDRARCSSVFARGAAIGASLVLAGMAVVAAGTPARSSPSELPAVAAVEVEVGELPPVSVGDQVAH